jgi:hypothetical protein
MNAQYWRVVGFSESRCWAAGIVPHPGERGRYDVAGSMRHSLKYHGMLMTAVR